MPRGRRAWGEARAATPSRPSSAPRKELQSAHSRSQHGKEARGLNRGVGEPTIERLWRAHPGKQPLRQRKHAAAIETYLGGEHDRDSRQRLRIAGTCPAGRPEVAPRAEFEKALFLRSRQSATSGLPGVLSLCFGERRWNQVSHYTPVTLDGDGSKRRSLQHLAQSILEIRGINGIHAPNDMPN